MLQETRDVKHALQFDNFQNISTSKYLIKCEE